MDPLLDSSLLDPMVPSGPLEEHFSRFLVQRRWKVSWQRCSIAIAYAIADAIADAIGDAIVDAIVATPIQGVVQGAQGGAKVVGDSEVVGEGVSEGEGGGGGSRSRS